jgi:hypothetical protein
VEGFAKINLELGSFILEKFENFSCVNTIHRTYLFECVDMGETDIGSSYSRVRIYQSIS